MSRAVGLVLAVVGAILLVVGFQSSNAPVDQVSNALTGRFTDQTMMYLLGGAAALVGGLVLSFAGGRR